MQQLVFEFGGGYLILCFLAAFLAAALLYAGAKEFPESYKSWKYGLPFFGFAPC